MENKIVFSGLFWRFAERCGAQGVKFVVEIILARLLLPEDYGTVALVTVIITILQVFVDSGLGNALIQKKDADEWDFSTVFYMNIVFCIILYIMVWLLAPWISGFYSRPEMVSYIRVLGLAVLISGAKNVQQAYVFRNLLFKKFFFSTLGGTVIAAAIGIRMAYLGFGVWALVMQHLTNLFVDTLILWITVKWRPHLKFSFTRLKRLFSYGWKLLVSALLDTAYSNLYSLLIGKVYSSSELAFYNQGDKFPRLVVNNINTSIDSVLLPVMSSVQDDRVHVKNMVRRSIKTSVYILAPMMMGLAFVAMPLVRMTLTEKWLPCVPFLRIFCIAYMFYPIHTANLSAIKAMGQSGQFLKLEIWKKGLGTVVLFCTMQFGVKVMAYGTLLMSVVSQIINAGPNRKLLNYGYLEQLKDIFPSVLLAVVMGVLISWVELLGLPDILTILVQVVLGAAIYIAVSAILKLDSFQYLWGILRSVLLKGLR